MVRTSVASDPTGAAKIYGRLGALFYALWGLWHLRVIYRLFISASALETDAVQARLLQGAFHILGFALAALLIALLLNRKNSVVGYWANLLMLSYTEIGLFAFIILPGYSSLVGSLVGPSLWLLGVVFSTSGVRARHGDQVFGRTSAARG